MHYKYIIISCTIEVRNWIILLVPYQLLEFKMVNSMEIKAGIFHAFCSNVSIFWTSDTINVFCLFFNSNFRNNFHTSSSMNDLLLKSVISIFEQIFEWIRHKIVIAPKEKKTRRIRTQKYATSITTLIMIVEFTAKRTAQLFFNL